MGVLDDAIREHLDLKRRRGATDDEIARAEAEALGPARRAPSPDDEGDEEGLGGAETILVPPARDPAPPPEAVTRVVHDIDEDPLAPPAPVDRVDRPDLDVSPLDQDTVEHPAPARLPFDADEDADDEPRANADLPFDHAEDQPRAQADLPFDHADEDDEATGDETDEPAGAESDEPADAGPGRLSE
ncbi:MAG TPA: hypothetical protein VJT75_14600 [Thermoleophilaceae bacterium]|nr:hypothetical protein [Thermoleophilaceae bacterium]